MSGTRTVAGALGAREGNNFDALRLGAASLVVFSHSFHVTGGPDAFEPLEALTGGQTTFGYLAVLVFFVLSGFLVTRSWLSAPSVSLFARKRALRIFPALAVVVLFCVLVIGAAFTTLPHAEYFASTRVWAYLGKLGLYTRGDDLPGVFSGHPIAGAMNGPLWTLKFEILCYVAVAALGATRTLRALPIAGLLLALYVVAALRGEGGQEGAAYSLFTLAELARPFLAGALAALLADRIALRARYALGAALAMIALTALGLFDAAFPLFGAYLVLYAGFVRAPLLKRLSPPGDYSYGLYVWGFPMQQMTQALLPAAWFVNFVIAFPLALAAAALSWRFIESPALRLKPGGAAEPKRFVTISQARQGSLRPQSAPLQSSQ